MHPCLAVQDIVELIVRFAEDASLFVPGRQPPPSLVLLRTCKSFYEPACNVRWRHLSRFEPLLRLFDHNPALSKGNPMSIEEFIQAARPDSWARFLHHARRVRTVTCMWQWHTIAYLKTLHAFRPDQDIPLLPGLRVLIYTAYQPVGSADALLPIKLLAHPGLHTLRITSTVADGQEPPSLEFLGQLAPRIQRLHVTFATSLFSMSSRIRSHITLPTLDHLTTFHCQSTLTPHVMNRLGQLPGLKSLNVSIDRQVTSSLPDDVAMFPTLQSLLLTSAGSDTDVTSVLRLISSPHLRRFDLCLDRHPSAAHFRQYIHLLAQKPLLSRCDIRISRSFDLDGWDGDDDLSDTPALVVTGNDLRPLLSLPRMSTLVLRDFPLSLTDGDLEEMAVAWPQLRDLVLGLSYGSRRSGVTLEGLKPLSLHCSKLRCLALSMNALSPAGSPAVEPPTGRSRRRLRGFAKLRPPILSKRRSLVDLPMAVASPDATGWCGSDSVCTRLEHIDIGNTLVEDPYYVASFIAQHFPNVRSVTDIACYMGDLKMIDKINKVLSKQGKERWAVFDKMAPHADTALMRSCFCGRCKINPLFAILYLSSVELSATDWI